MSKTTLEDIAYMIHRGFSVEQKPLDECSSPNDSDYPDLSGETSGVWHDQTELIDSWAKREDR